MRCMGCGGDMVVTATASDDAALPAGFTHETLQCLACGDTERRLAFNPALIKTNASTSACLSSPPQETASSSPQAPSPVLDASSLSLPRKSAHRRPPGRARSRSSATVKPTFACERTRRNLIGMRDLTRPGRSLLLLHAGRARTVQTCARRSSPYGNPLERCALSCAQPWLPMPPLGRQSSRPRRSSNASTNSATACCPGVTALLSRRRLYRHSPCRHR